jgi:uncharacterized protein
MAEKKIKITKDGGGSLEGLMHEGTAGCGVVITHPHPLFGGDMYNNVVEAIQTAYQEKGYSTLRFNFRGVGGSTDRYDEGKGEQQDVLAACNFLEDSGAASIHLAGYSFGAWVIARVADKLPDSPMIMISPPAAMLSFPQDLKLPGLKLVVTGSADEFAAPELISGLVSRWNPSAPFEIIDGADHFFWGFMEALEKVLKNYI